MITCCLRRGSGRAATSWKAIATPQNRPQKRPFPPTPKTGISPTPASGAEPPQSYRISVKLTQKNHPAASGLSARLRSEAFLGRFGEFLVKRRFRYLRPHGEKARAPPPTPHVLGRFGGFLVVITRRRASPAQNELRKRDFGSCSRPQRQTGTRNGDFGDQKCKMGSGRGILGPAHFPVAKWAQKVRF